MLGSAVSAAKAPGAKPSELEIYKVANTIVQYSSCKRKWQDIAADLEETLAGDRIDGYRLTLQELV